MKVEIVSQKELLLIKKAHCIQEAAFSWTVSHYLGDAICTTGNTVFITLNTELSLLRGRESSEVGDNKFPVGCSTWVRQWCAERTWMLLG